MESSWYLCAIKVLYTGRATFESRVLTGHRFRGRPKRSALHGARERSSCSLLLPLFHADLRRRWGAPLSSCPPTPLSSFMNGEVTDLLTMPRTRDDRRKSPLDRRKRREEGDQRRDFVATMDPSAPLAGRQQIIHVLSEVYIGRFKYSIFRKKELSICKAYLLLSWIILIPRCLYFYYLSCCVEIFTEILFKMIKYIQNLGKRILRSLQQTHIFR